MKHPLHNRILGILFMAAIAVSYVLFVPITQVYLRLRKRKRDLAWLGFGFFNGLLRVFRSKPEIVGKENIPQGQSFILLSNHQSFVDIGFLISTTCPIAFLAKKELFKLPFFGESLKFMGCIPVDRGNRRANLELPNLLRQRITQEQYNYCVFPEGTRSIDGSLLVFKAGIFKIIKEAPVPILPVTIIGSGKVMPKKGLSFYTGQKPRIVIHPVITPEQIETLSADDLREQVHRTIGSALI